MAKGKNDKRRRMLGISAIFIMVVGLGGFARYGSDVRDVDKIGLFVSGIAAGIGVALLVVGLKD